MRYLGIDFGVRKIGVAISDAAGSFAFPKDTIANDGSTLEALQKMIEKEKIEGLVIGDTRSDDGAENSVTQKAENFVKALESKTGLTVHRAREAWSSFEAARYAPPRERHTASSKNHHDDSAAAAIILQRFLDSKGGVL